MDLRTYRARRGLSQTQLAALLGMSQGALSHLECGRRAPSARTIRRVYEVTDGEVTANDLLGLATTATAPGATE